MNRPPRIVDVVLPPNRVTIVGGFKQEEVNLDKWNVRTKRVSN